MGIDEAIEALFDAATRKFGGNLLVISMADRVG